MAIQDLYQALQIFQNGVNQLSATRVLNRANEITQEIRNSEADEAQKTSALRNLGQQIAFGLAANPAMNAGSLQQVLETFPQRPQMPQSIFQGLVSDDPTIRQRSLEAAELENQFEIKKQKAVEELYDRRQEASDARIRNRQKDAREFAQEVAKQKREVPGYGYAVNEKAAAEAREVISEIETAKANIAELREIAKNFPAKGKIDPRIIKRAKKLAVMTRGGLRITAVGPGPVSDTDMEILDSLIDNPTDALQIFPEVGLETLERALQRKLNITLKLSGLGDPKDLVPAEPPPEIPFDDAFENSFEVE